MLQRRVGYAWRRLRRTVEKLVAEHKDMCEYIYGAKKKLVSVDLEPLVRLAPTAEAEKVDLQWFQRSTAKKIAAFVAAVDGEVSRAVANGGQGG